GRAGSSENMNLAGQAAVGTLGSKTNVHQGAGLDIFKRCRGLAVTDACVLINTEAYRNGVDGVAQRQLVMGGVDGGNLAVSIRGQWSHAHTDVAGKNIVPVIVQLRVDVHAFAFLKRELGSFRSVVEDVRTFVKIYGPLAAAKNTDRHAVA